ncbi:phosphonoacetaldehyde reductase [Salininema proteolyticum]|uniref:Phosphonoacetaldehyde reductase n=1 Tax=Salininema proteolyticum TaxID=1607685 RepID=A0ABV8TZN5_9ACTN
MPQPVFTDRDVVFGSGTITQAGQVASSLGARRILLVRGKNSFAASGADACLPGLNAAAEVREWSDYHPNIYLPDVLSGLRTVEEFRPDTIVAVGGGSAMDIAKLLAVFKGKTEEGELAEAVKAGVERTERHLNLVLAPTTSGSGSEATRFALTYIGDDKFSVRGPGLLPDRVIVDPDLTLSASRYQRATSGIDALAQAIEGIWAVKTNERARAYGHDALKILIETLPAFANGPTEANARDMALGSHLAGRSIDISLTTASHALSYGITGFYGPSHGHAVALTLGAFLERHATAEADQLQEGLDLSLHRQGMDLVLSAFGTDDPAEARATWSRVMDSIGLETSLGAVGADTREKRYALAAGANPVRLGNNPLLLDKEIIADVLESVA